MSFRDEYIKLWEWFSDEGKKLETSHVPQSGFDDWLMYARRPLIREYNRRLAELKAKYGFSVDEPVEAVNAADLTEKQRLKIFGAE